MPRTPGTIQTIETSNVPIVDLPLAMPSVAESAGGVPISQAIQLQLQYTLAQPQMAPVALPQMALPQMALPRVVLPQTPPMQATMQPLGMQVTAMPSVVPPSIMTVKPNQLGLISAPLNIQGTHFKAHNMPNPVWQVSSRDQLLQDQLQRDRQEFQAWKLEMSKNLAQGIQPQAQAPSLVDLTEPPDDIDGPEEVVNKPQRSASVKRSRSPDQSYIVSKRARSTTTTSRDNSLPKRTTHE